VAARSATTIAPGTARPNRPASVRCSCPTCCPRRWFALFVACSSTCIYGTVGSWMPLYLATEKALVDDGVQPVLRVPTAFAASSDYVRFGWLIDRIGRRRTFIVTLIEGAIFMTLWVYSESHVLLWAFGLAWSLGFLGFWGPSTTLTAEVFPTRIRGAANGVVWAIAYFVGFVLFPFVTIALQQHTGSFALAFLCIPVLMIAMAIRCDDDGARTFRQGAERDHRVSKACGAKIVGWTKARMRRAHHLSGDGGHASLCPPYYLAPNPCSRASG